MILTKLRKRKALSKTLCSPQGVEQVSENDPAISKLRQVILTIDWTCFRGIVFQAVKEELWRGGHIVMRGTRIIILKALQTHVVDLGLEWNQGIVRTKNCLQFKVWWPEMDKMAEKTVGTCHPCKVAGKNAPPKKVEHTLMPDQPWSYLAVDLLSISKENCLLALVDYYFWWPEVTYMTVEHDRRWTQRMWLTCGTMLFVMS